MLPSKSVTAVSTQRATHPADMSGYSSQLVFRINIFIVSVLSLSIILTLPRALVRFSRASEWTEGNILHTVPPERRKQHRIHPSPGKTGAQPDDWHVFHSDKHLAYRSSGKRTTPSYPPHIAAWPAVTRPLAWLLYFRVSPGFSLGQALALLSYSGVIVYGWFYRSNPITDPDRSGFVSVSQIPLLFAFATKNNLLGLMVGLGYEKLNFLHRFAGRLITLAADIHALGYVYKYTVAGVLIARLQRPPIIWGLVALLCLNLSTFFSFSFWRRRTYTFFFTSHVISFCIFLPAICYHTPFAIPYVLVASIIYAFDRLLRIFKTRFCKARIHALPELQLTHISIQSPNAGWRAGQHIRLRVLSFRMGVWGWTEAHPFTIASISGTDEGLVVLCRKSGDWTGRLYEMAKAAGYGDVACADFGRNVRVWVEGPYGGPGHMIFASYSAALFVVGGSGITFALAAVQDLVQKDLESASRVKVIEVIWILQDPSSLVPLYPQLASIIQRSPSPLHISIHYTRATKSPPPKDLKLIPGLSFSPGRPRICKVLDGAMACAVSLGYGAKDNEAIKGVLVGVCGPVGLRDEVAEIVRGVDARRRDAVGGVEIYEEVFGW